MDSKYEFRMPYVIDSAFMVPYDVGGLKFWVNIDESKSVFHVKSDHYDYEEENRTTRGYTLKTMTEELAYFADFSYLSAGIFYPSYLKENNVIIKVYHYLGDVHFVEVLWAPDEKERRILYKATRYLTTNGNECSYSGTFSSSKTDIERMYGDIAERITKEDHTSSIPEHYMHKDSIECLEAMYQVFGKDEVLAFCKLNAFKYLWRSDCKHETPEEDIGKAVNYLRRYLDFYSRKE